MIRINLAPELKSAQNYSEVLRGPLIVLIIAALAYYGPQWYADMLQGESQQIRDKTAEKKAELKNLELDFGRMKGLQATITELRARYDMIRSLGKARKQPVLVLDKLQQLHMERMWLENMSFNGKLLSMSGWATDYGVISEYVRRLKVTNGEEGDNDIDTRNFKPTFGESPEAEVKPDDPHKSIVPLRFANVMLTKSTLGEIEGFPLQHFDIEFNPNIENINLGP